MHRAAHRGGPVLSQSQRKRRMKLGRPRKNLSPNKTPAEREAEMMTVIAKSCGITLDQARIRFARAWRKHQADIASLIADGCPAQVANNLPFYWVAPRQVTFYYVLGGDYGTNPHSKKARLCSDREEAQGEVKMYTMLDQGRIRDLLRPNRPRK